MVYFLLQPCDAHGLRDNGQFLSVDSCASLALSTAVFRTAPPRILLRSRQAP